MYAFHTRSLMTKPRNNCGFKQGFNFTFHWSISHLTWWIWTFEGKCFSFWASSLDQPESTSTVAFHTQNGSFGNALPSALSDVPLILICQRGWAALLFVPFCIISYWAGEQTSACCHLFGGEFWLLKHFQLMPFLIMKNKENGPDLVQLCVPLSAASLLWFLLPPFFHLQPFCNDPRTLSFPSGLHLAVHPALLCCSD